MREKACEVIYTDITCWNIGEQSDGSVALGGSVACVGLRRR